MVKAVEGTWLDFEGNNFSGQFNNWQSGQPSAHSEDEDFAVMYTDYKADPTRNGLWHDHPAYYPANVICKKPANAGMKS